MKDKVKQDIMGSKEHKCDQPKNRLCWDCGFCGHREGCTEPVDGYGNAIKGGN